MLKRLANAAKTWVVVGVGALVLGLAAFFILSNFSPDSTFAHPHDPVQTHEGVGTNVEHIHYDEKDDDPVITLMSTDPETGDTVDWDVTGTDADDFIISSSGVLNFKEPPNYEKATDREHDEDGNESITNAGEDNAEGKGNRRYDITVRATEQTTPGDPMGRALSTETDLIIVVNNVDEDGMVELDLLQPEVGTKITAMLMDEDGPVSGQDAISVTWEWSVSKVTNPNMNTEAHWTVIPQSEASVDGDGFTPRGVRAAAITPRPDPNPSSAIDEGEFVRAKASYTDGFGEERTAIGVSVHPVRAEVDANNDQGVEDATNDSPGFRQGLNYNRSVPENTLVDMNVRGPVTALDPNGDILSYSLMRVGEQMTAPNYGDRDFFNIDRASGQITVENMLDFEEEDGRTYGATGATAGEYKVIVRATDPSGETGDVPVTITATSANDDPVISGREELSVMEQDSDDRDGDDSPDSTYTGLPDMNVNQVSTNGDNPNVYRASDDDARGLISWNLKQSNSDPEAVDYDPEAVDYALFELSSTDLTGDDRPRAIRFKNAPDFEYPGDANRDNVYKVTLVATDGSGRDEHRVSIFVMNVHEQGELTLMASGNDPAQPVIGQPITAMVGDPDGGMAVVTWQWSRSDTKDGEYTPITGATSATYIPQGDRPSGLADDADTEDVDESVTSDVGMFLRSVATYLDATSAEDDPTTDNVDERVQTGDTTAKTASMGDGDNVTSTGEAPDNDSMVYRVMVTTEKAVRASDDEPGTTDPGATPTPPTFDPGSYTGTVYENSEVGSLVAMSDMVSAMSGEMAQTLMLDPQDSDDNKFFTIDEHGQIRVGEVPYPDPLPTGVQAPTATAPAMVDPDQDLVPALDYETRTTYRLVLSAENDGGKSTANMTISLMDRNEHPYFDKATREIDFNTDDTGFDGTIEFTEFVTGAAYNRKVTDLAAVEPDGDSLDWEVIGTDAADFETVDAPDGPDGKDRVELRFKENSQPDFERPMDRLLDMDLDGIVDTGDDAAGNNMYRITVRITEASTVGAGVAPKAAELDLTVQVMDGEEKGSVQIDLRQPEVMTPIMASVTDPDLVADANVDGDVGTANVTVTYKWYRAKGSNFNRNITELADDGDNQWEPITGGNAGTATYTPQGAPANDPATNEDENVLGTAVDEGRHLLVRAMYNSDIPSTDDQGVTVDMPPVVAFGITEYPVRADVHDDSNNSPGFPSGSLTRTMAESIVVDGAVGNPVRVNLNEDDDVLTYSLVTSDAGLDGNGDVETDDLPFFYIDNDTGQIRVKKELNFEGHDLPSLNIVEPSEYQVVVRATDPSGEDMEENRDDITVVITVTDVNEAPKVTDGFSIIQVNEVNSSKKSTDNGQYYIGLGNTALTESPYTVTKNANAQNYYKRSDEDPVDSHEWPNNPIPGPDGEWFEYSTAEDGVRLHFIEPPDYEDLNDANGDNVYEVCVTAVDNGNMRGCKMVRIEVMNVQEDGMLMLTPADPVEAMAGDGVEITATLTDPDGEVVITDWNWANRGVSGGMFSDAMMVDGRTTMTFKGEVGNFVWSEVHYRDGASVVDDPVTALDERNDAMDGGDVEQHKFQNYLRETDGSLDLDADDNPQLDTNDDSFHNSDEMLEKVTDSAVQAPEGDTTTPDPGDTTTDPIGPPSVINIERSVPENTPSTGYVGIPLKKYEMPGTMTGPDANLFVFAEVEDQSADGYYDSDLQDNPDVMDKMGQLALAVTPAGTPITDLDSEASKNSYIIEFSEGQANSDIIRVTILVTDVNEAPSMPMEARGGIHINGPPSINRYDEGRTDMVATYSTMGGEAGATVTWSLDGDDRGDFRISSGGELTFRAIPDFEDPMDSNTDNIYSITVEVQDDTTPNPNVDTLFVTVTVGNVDEPGMLTVTSDRPAVDRMITAMLEDDDGIIGSVMWMWSMADELDGTYEAIEDADDAMYTVTEDDVEMFLQVKATYEDGHGRNKMKTKNFMYAVTMSLVFASDMVEIMVDENTGGDTEIGDPVVASGGQAETVMHAITGGADMAAFTIDAMSGQVSTAAATMLDYETKDMYTFEVTATGTAADSSTETAMTMVTVMVQNLDEAGTVTLSPTVGRVDMEITATLDDPDGGVTGLVWQWESADAMAGPWTPITGATLPSYTPVAGDTDKYLRAVADYDDAESSPKTAMMMTSSKVGETPSTGHANADLYDTTPQDGMINGKEALDAVVDYFNGVITSEELLDVLVAYFG